MFRDGNTRTYVAYNAGDDAAAVSFSDGTELTVEPNETTTATRTFESLPSMDGAFPRVDGSNDDSRTGGERGGKGGRDRNGRRKN